MKKILMAGIIFLTSFLNADEYQSLHNGTFLTSLLNTPSFINNQVTPQGYLTTITMHSAKSAISGLPYYPQGWNKFKLYIPSGLEYISINLATMPNATLRIHTKFRADINNEMNHYATEKMNQGYLFYAENQLTTESILTNTGQYYYPDVERAGWLYFDVVEDRLNSYSEHADYDGDVQLYITVRSKKNNDVLFNNWSATTYFLTPGGDPSALVQNMNIVDVTTQDVQTPRTINLDFGGTLHDGTPISSASNSSISSTAATSSAASVSSSISSTTSSLSNSSSSNPCGIGYYQSPDTGGCVPLSIGGASSSFNSSSSLPYCDTLSSSSSGGGILPMAVACITRPTSSASSVSSNPCGVGYYVSPDTGGCVPVSIGGASSSSSSSSVATQNASTTLQAGWNLISIPIATNQEIDVNATLNGKATIAYKFDANATSIWEKWLPGVSMRLKNGQGLFAGVPTGSTPSINFSVIADTNSTKFESTSYAVKTWYLLGFGYDITVETIKTKYPNSVIFTMENGAYIKQDANATIIENGTGFWFKYYDVNGSI